MGLADEIEKHKTGILTSLTVQGETLKRVKLRTLQMFNSLGMSENILILIERRSRADMIIFCLLVVFTLLLIYGLCLYKWGQPEEIVDVDESVLNSD